MNVERIGTKLPGCFELRPRVLADDRGCFVKTFQRDWFESLGLRTDWAEQYYSVSQPGVVRGLHFQAPPHEHAKLIYCISGRVLDVALDLREGLPSYSQHIQIELSAEAANMLYLPPGFAHGFCTLDEPATLVYNVTSVYHSNSDTGIRWDTAGIDWPLVAPQLSERDRNFPALADFASPFAFHGEWSSEHQP